MSASWPTSVASDSTLYVAVNELQNNLSGAINNSVTTIGLNSTTGFPTVGLVLIDNEVIKYGGISGNNLTSCTRAFDGTTAVSHSSAAVVSFAFCAAHHNNLKDEIIAIETSLNLTASKALSTDTNGRVAVATTTLAELNFVAGVTSAIQTQLNLKAPLAGPTFSGTITTPLTASRALQTGASNELAVSATTATELGYLSGVTSAIQTQLAGKASTTLSNVASVSADVPMNSHKFTGLAAGSAAGDSLRFEQMKVLQIVSASTTTSTSSSSTSFVDATNMTVSITPTSASNKILVIVSGVLASAVSGKAAYATIVRGSTNLGDTTSGFMSVFPGSSSSVYSGASMTYLDSPATTSPTAYKVQIHSDASGQAIWGDTGNQKTITVMEVAS